MPITCWEDEVSSSTASKWAVQENTLSGPWGFLLKEHIQCICEGGARCKREDPAKQTGPNAVEGVHSNWVTKDVLAMARPWQENILQQNVPQSFVNQHIGIIINLQEIGEHAGCGPGVMPESGFSYNPETFMAANIGFYNTAWRDMGVPNLAKAMDIVQIMTYIIKVQKKKVAVHCHAGLGRTGLAIACYLVFSGDYTADEAVVIVRSSRPGALQTNAQVMFVHVFEQYVKYLRRTFPGVSGDGPRKHRRTSQLQQNVPSGNVLQGILEPEQSVADESVGSQAALKAVVEDGCSKVHVYTNGLMIVRPITLQGSAKQLKSDQRLLQDLPWTADFSICTKKFQEDLEIHPPSSYREALWRQQRLLHGHERRAYQHVHKVPVKIAEALTTAMNDTVTKTHLQQHFSIWLDYLAKNQSQEELARLGAVQAQHLKAELNRGSFSSLDSASLPALMISMTDWFQPFSSPSLTAVTTNYLHESPLSSLACSIHDPGGKDRAAAVGKVLRHLLPIPTVDQELLLLFSGMIRHFQLQGLATTGGVDLYCDAFAALLLGSTPLGQQNLPAVSDALRTLTTSSLVYLCLYALKVLRYKARIDSGESTPLPSSSWCIPAAHTQPSPSQCTPPSHHPSYGPQPVSQPIDPHIQPIDPHIQPSITSDCPQQCSLPNVPSCSHLPQPAGPRPDQISTKQLLGSDLQYPLTPPDNHLQPAAKVFSGSPLGGPLGGSVGGPVGGPLGGSWSGPLGGLKPASKPSFESNGLSPLHSSSKLLNPSTPTLRLCSEAGTPWDTPGHTHVVQQSGDSMHSSLACVSVPASELGQISTDLDQLLRQSADLHYAQQRFPDLDPSGAEELQPTGPLARHSGGVKPNSVEHSMMLNSQVHRVLLQGAPHTSPHHLQRPTANYLNVAVPETGTSTPNSLVTESMSPAASPVPAYDALRVAMQSRVAHADAPFTAAGQAGKLLNFSSFGALPAIKPHR